MIIQKLPWAGIRIASGETSVVIDPLFHFPSKFGTPDEPFFPLDEFGPVQAVLVTHHHGDHFDPQGIAKFYGSDIPVYVPADMPRLPEHAILSSLRKISPGESVQIGSLLAIAENSVDGVGDPPGSMDCR